MAPVLAEQLRMALQELTEAGVGYAKARCQNKRALNMKRYLVRAAKLRCKGAELRMKGVKEEIKGKRCLFLHNMEQVQAVMELLKELDKELDRGCLQRVEVKCRKAGLAREMHEALIAHGFKNDYVLPPA